MLSTGSFLISQFSSFTFNQVEDLKSAKQLSRGFYLDPKMSLNQNNSLWYKTQTLARRIAAPFSAHQPTWNHGNRQALFDAPKIRVYGNILPTIDHEVTTVYLTQYPTTVSIFTESGSTFMFLMTKNRKFYSWTPESSENCKTYVILEKPSDIKIDHPALQTMKSSFFLFHSLFFSFLDPDLQIQILVCAYLNPVPDLKHRLHLLFSSLTFNKPKKTNLKKFSAYYFLKAPYIFIIFKDKKSKRSHKTVGIKVFLTNFA